MLNAEDDSLANLVCGPLIGAFIAWLSSTVRQNDVSDVYFASREGYFLKRYWDAWHEAGDGSEGLGSHYLLTSRVSLTRCLLEREASWDAILRHPYSGGSDHFLRNRLGINDDQLVDLLATSLPPTLDLPLDRQQVESELRTHHAAVRAFSSSERAEMQEALDSVSFTGSARQALVDVGYSGTIPQLLAEIVETHDFAKLYLVGNSNFFRLPRADSFVGQREWGCGDPIIDCSLILEGLLQAPHGSLRRFKGGSPVFDEFALQPESSWERLSQIHEMGITWMLEHRAVLQMNDAVHASQLGLSVFIRQALDSPEQRLDFLEVDDMATGEDQTKGWRLQAEAWVSASFKPWDWVGDPDSSGLGVQ